MPHFALRVLLRLVGENRNFLRLTVFHNLTGNRSALHIRSANLQAILAAERDNLECNLLILSSCKLFNKNDVAVQMCIRDRYWA